MAIRSNFGNQPKSEWKSLIHEILKAVIAPVFTCSVPAFRRTSWLLLPGRPTVAGRI